MVKCSPGEDAENRNESEKAKAFAPAASQASKNPVLERP
jgi:hypothetical protein